MTDSQRELAIKLFERGIVRFGEFEMKDGSVSPVYIDLRLLVSRPDALEMVVSAVLNVLEDLVALGDLVFPIFYAASPLLGSLVLEGYLAVYVRKEDDGRHRRIEGEFEQGQKVVIIDDVITTGASKVEVWKPLKEAGLVVENVVVLVDRDQGGAEKLAKSGKTLHAVLHLREMLEVYVEEGLITKQVHDESIAFLSTRTCTAELQARSERTRPSDNQVVPVASRHSLAEATAVL